MLDVSYGDIVITLEKISFMYKSFSIYIGMRNL